MQDHEDMSSADVTKRGPYEDRTRPISCSVAAGVSSNDRMLHSKAHWTRRYSHYSSEDSWLTEDRTR
jgi:hypothetical protein